MCATLFLTYADIEMSKVVTSLISKDKLDMVELWAQIKALKSTPWYKGSRESAKLGASGPGETNGLSPGGKWCSNCNKAINSTEQCWGQCPHCLGRGHLPEKCRFKKVEETKKATAEEERLKAKKVEENKKKKLRKKAMKNKNKEQANKVSMGLPGAEE